MKSIAIGIGIIFLAGVSFIAGIYLDESEVVQKVVLYSAYGPIENVFFSLFSFMLILVVLLAKWHVGKEPPFTSYGILFSVCIVTGFILFGIYSLVALGVFSKIYAHRIVQNASNHT